MAFLPARPERPALAVVFPGARPTTPVLLGMTFIAVSVAADGTPPFRRPMPRMALTAVSAPADAVEAVAPEMDAPGTDAPEADASGMDALETAAPEADALADFIITDAVGKAPTPSTPIAFLQII